MKSLRLSLSVLLLVCTAAWLCGEAPTAPAGSLKGLAHTVPKDFHVLVALGDLDDLLGLVSGIVGELGMPGITRTWAQAGEESTRVLGFDATSAEAWGQAGFALDQPVGFAFKAEPGANLMLLVAGFRDEARMMERLRQWTDRAGLRLVKADGQGQVFHHLIENGEENSFSLAFKGNRAYALASPDKLSGMDQRLQAILDLDEAASLAADPDFREAVDPVPASGYISLFIRDFERLFPSRSEDPSDAHALFVKAVKSFSLVLGERDSALSAITRFPLPLVGSLQPGLECGTLLSRMEKPAFAFSVNVEWTEELAAFCRAMAAKAPLKTGGEAESGAAFQTEWENLLGTLKGKVALGGAFYLRPDDFSGKKTGFHLPDLILAARLADPSVIDALFAKVKTITRTDPVKLGDGELFTLAEEGASLSLGRAGDTFFLGHTDRVRKVLEAKEALWTPRCGGADLLAYELFTGDILKLMPLEKGQDELKAVFGTLFKPGSSAFVSLNARPNSVLIRMNTQGTRLMVPFMAGVIAIPSLLEAKLSAQRNAAVATLHLVSLAEEAYAALKGAPSRRATFAELVGLGLLDARFGTDDPVFDGYRYSLQATETGFRCEARGVGPNTGRVLSIDETGTLRTGEDHPEATPEKPPGPSSRPEAEYLDLGRRIAEAYNTRSVEKTMELYDMELFFRSVESELALDPETARNFRSGMLIGFRNAFTMNMEIMEQNRNRLRMIRVLEVDGEKRVRFRIIGATGIDYLDAMVQETPSGALKVTDSYSFSAGLSLSKTLKSALVIILGGVTGSGLSKPAADLSRDLTTVQDVRQAMLAGDLAEALKLWGDVSAGTKATRLGYSIRMELAGLQGDEELLEAIRSFSVAFPNDPIVESWRYDHAERTEDLDGASAALEALDRKIQGDPYLDSERATVALQRGTLDEARRLAEKVRKLDPDFEDPCLVLLFCDIQEERFAAAATWCDVLKKHFDIDLSEALKDPQFEAFTRSEEYQAWQKSLTK
ncbi:MAG: hypothetical protein KA419_06310 [Acidobacteria bacterium]|nr:hypothetical protein [Acidobacteriota bacterium]